MPRKPSESRVDDKVVAILTGATNHETFSKRQLAETLGVGMAPVSAALARLRSGDAPLVSMIGNKRGARYGAADPSIATA